MGNDISIVLLSSVKVAVQFETEGNGQNKIVSHMNRSEVNLKNSEKNCDISYTERDFETEKWRRKWASGDAKTFLKNLFLETIFMSEQWDTRGFNSGSFLSNDFKFCSFTAQ